MPVYSIHKKLQCSLALDFILLLLALCWLFFGLKLQAESPKKGKMLVLVTRSDANFEKHALSDLKKDIRRTKADLTIKSLDAFSTEDFSAYHKVAVIAYISDIKGPLLNKLRNFQAETPDTLTLWLVYSKKEPPLPAGLDAVSSASEEYTAIAAYAKNITPFLFQ